jgi:hypothetical protein
VSRFRYRVACLTHGHEEEPLRETLESFEEFVTPAPLDWIIAQDGPGYWTIPEHFSGYAGQPWVGQVGFCEATRRLWEMASKSRELNYGKRGQAFFIPDPPPFIFWLEHDFRFTRPLDLEPLAAQLEADPTLSQMALMRGPVNPEEEAVGGLIGKHADEFEQDWTNLPDRSEAYPFLRWRHFTTNPSLMRTAFMREEEWPSHGPACEGLFGLRLADSGYHGGVWGSGEVWVEHTGVRTGKGY